MELEELEELEESDRFEEFEDRERRAFRKGVLVGCLASIGVLVLIGVLGLFVVGVLIEEGILPDSAAVAGHELNERTLEFLREEGLVSDDEQVAYFYSDGLFSPREDGNLYTDRRVVSYWEGQEGLQVESAAYHEVAMLSYSPDDDLFANSVITVARVDGTQFELFVSNEEEKDDEFFEQLNRTWIQRRNGDPARPGTELGADVLEVLHDESILETDEEVLFFYAKARGSPRADGNLFTDRRVISYWEMNGEISLRDAPYARIENIEAAWGEGLHGVTTVRIELDEGEPFELWVSPEDGGDRAFVRGLEEAWRTNR